MTASLEADMPKIDNAPGLTWRKTKIGWEARWRARTDLCRRGFKPRVVRLWTSEPDEIEPTDFSISYIQDRCTALQSEMLVWGRGGLPVTEFDGTIAALVNAYQTDEDSPYKNGRYNTRGYYDILCRMLVRDIGHKRIGEVTARDLLKWHRQYADRVAMGHSLVGMLRTLCTFGATLLGVKDCRELKLILSDMRFKMAKPRTERLTAQQVIAIRKIAPKSIALAQALQFEMTLRQKDVIGEWVPISEDGISAVINGNDKWLRGLDWKEIDQNWICTHVTSKRQKEITVDLKIAPMVVEELRSLDRNAFPASGPVIINEKTGLPYTTGDFRKAWRKIANSVGLPKTVRNMDTRAGAISEALNSGADIEKVRKAATHSDQGMTQKYSRGDAEATADVMRIRVASRKTDPERGSAQ
jgi:hypothetical protein